MGTMGEATDKDKEKEKEKEKKSGGGRGIYLEACEIVLMGDRFCEVTVDLWRSFIDRWGRKPEEVVIEACLAMTAGAGAGATSKE